MEVMQPWKREGEAEIIQDVRVKATFMGKGIFGSCAKQQSTETQKRSWNRKVTR